MYENDHIEPEFLKRQKKNPFQTPEQYFETLEDRILKNITNENQTKARSFKLIKFIKPALGIAASITLIYLVMQAPIELRMFSKVAQKNIPNINATTPAEEYSFLLTSTDENTLINAISSGETNDQEDINQDEVLAYLSTGLNDVEIYSEIQN